MGWLSKVFSSVGANVVTAVGDAIDNLVTSDEELALTDIQKLKIKAELKQNTKMILLAADRLAAQKEQAFEAELTARHKSDMQSDSWLSKNVRPVTLMFLTAVVSILSFATIFTDGLTYNQLDTIEQWVPFYQVIMLAVYGFYFGSRGFEKIQKIKAEGPGNQQ